MARLGVKAIRRRQDNLGDTHKFVAKFDPHLVEENISREMTAKIVEETRNCSEAVTGILGHMKTEYDLQGTSWWRSNGADLEESLAYLGSRKFSNTWDDGSKEETGQNLHKIAGRMASIRMPEMTTVMIGELATDAAFKAEAREWTTTLAEPLKLVSSLQAGYANLNKRELDVLPYLRENAGKNVRIESEFDNMGLSGDQQFLRKMMDSLIDVGNRRAQAHPDSNPTITVRWADKLGDVELGAVLQGNMADRGITKEFWVIDLMDTGPQPASMDQEVGMKNVYEFDDLMNKRKTGAFEILKPPTCGFGIRVILPYEDLEKTRLAQS